MTKQSLGGRPVKWWGSVCVAVLSVAAFSFLPGCSPEEEGSKGYGGGPDFPSPEAGGPTAESLGLTKAIAILEATEGNTVSGQVTFTHTDEGVLIEARIEGLTPGKHGFHIHQFGDITASDGTSSGGHFNPAGVDHGGPDSETRHVGDLGNLEAGDDGVAEYSRVDSHVALHGQNAVLGRAIVIHAGEDDLSSQPTGAAGARLAAGVIGLAP